MLSLPGPKTSSYSSISASNAASAGFLALEAAAAGAAEELSAMDVALEDLLLSLPSLAAPWGCPTVTSAALAPRVGAGSVGTETPAFPAPFGREEPPLAGWLGGGTSEEEVPGLGWG